MNEPDPMDDPGTGIDHRYPDVVAGLQHGIEQTGLDPVRARFQRERTALRHCVAGIERQIDQRVQGLRNAVAHR